MELPSRNLRPCLFEVDIKELRHSGGRQHGGEEVRNIRFRAPCYVHLELYDSNNPHAIRLEPPLSLDETTTVDICGSYVEYGVPSRPLTLLKLSKPLKFVLATDFAYFDKTDCRWAPATERLMKLRIQLQCGPQSQQQLSDALQRTRTCPYQENAFCFFASEPIKIPLMAPDRFVNFSNLHEKEFGARVNVAPQMPGHTSRESSSSSYFWLMGAIRLCKAYQEEGLEPPHESRLVVTLARPAQSISHSIPRKQLICPFCNRALFGSTQILTHMRDTHRYDHMSLQDQADPSNAAIELANETSMEPSPRYFFEWRGRSSTDWLKHCPEHVDNGPENDSDTRPPRNSLELPSPAEEANVVSNDGPTSTRNIVDDVHSNSLTSPFRTATCPTHTSEDEPNSPSEPSEIKADQTPHAPLTYPSRPRNSSYPIPQCTSQNFFFRTCSKRRLQTGEIVSDSDDRDSDSVNATYDAQLLQSVQRLNSRFVSFRLRLRSVILSHGPSSCKHESMGQAISTFIEREKDELKDPAMKSELLRGIRFIVGQGLVDSRRDYQGWVKALGCIR